MWASPRADVGPSLPHSQATAMSLHSPHCSSAAAAFTQEDAVKKGKHTHTTITVFKNVILQITKEQVKIPALTSLFSIK